MSLLCSPAPAEIGGVFVEKPAKEDYVCIMLDTTFQLDIHKKYNIWAFSYLLEHEKQQQKTRDFVQSPNGHKIILGKAGIYFYLEQMHHNRTQIHHSTLLDNFKRDLNTIGQKTLILQCTHYSKKVQSLL